MTQPAPESIPTPGKSTHQYLTAAARHPYVERAIELRNEGKSWREIGPLVGVPWQTVRNHTQAFLAAGFDGLLGKRENSGRPPEIELTEDQANRLKALYRRTNRTANKGSMATAAKFFALDPETPESVRHPILKALEKGRVPNGIVSLLRQVTVAHIEQDRRPGLIRSTQFSGQVGAFVDDKVERRRVIESDDGTINFVACIPWPMGGDACSDRFGVRVGRWQYLPIIECGWSHALLGYSLVCRQSGSYTAEDIRSTVKLVVEQYGLPDEFRFEHGSWEANLIVQLLRGLNVPLTTVNHPVHKPFIEGFFNKMWTYLSVLDGQVGRHRGDVEEMNRMVEAAKAGRRDPREFAPMLPAAIRALDGAGQMHNSDTIRSVYGSWVPEVRERQLAGTKPWRPLPAELRFLFSPVVKEWTVSKGTVGGDVPMMDDLSVPYYFAHEELWRWSGQKVRLYFDHRADPCTATIVAVNAANGYAAEQVICQAELLAGIPTHARASMGWSEVSGDTKVPQWRRAAMAALRRETRILDAAGGGKIAAATSTARDGRGNEMEVNTRGDRAHQPESEPTPNNRIQQQITVEPPPRNGVAVPKARQVEVDPRFADFVEA